MLKINPKDLIKDYSNAQYLISAIRDLHDSGLKVH